jgi:hypothetical protein
MDVVPAHRTPSDAEVRDQLDRILASAPFRNSRRASAMLRYTVAKALSGDSDALKERTIGVEVFGRQAGYETGTDHVVRSTAGDVRRRLAQFYQDNHEEAALLIAFAPGSYVPRFGSDQQDAVTGSALDKFWDPLLESGKPVLLCIGGPSLAPVLAGSAPEQPRDQLSLLEVFGLDSGKVAYSDAVTLAALTGFLAARGARYRVAHESEVELDDLRQGPAVLIGALNNDWGIRLAGQLRFTFDFDLATLSCSILDRGHVAWSLRLDVPFASVREDRGVVTRVMDQTTGQPTVLAGGATMLGTIAAGELLTNPAYMPDGEWDRPNAQVLFAATILRGSAAPPRALETWFW